MRGWDPASKRTIEGRARRRPRPIRRRHPRDTSAVAALSGGTVTVADRPVRKRRGDGAGQERRRAASANAYVSGGGTCRWAIRRSSPGRRSRSRERATFRRHVHAVGDHPISAGRQGLRDALRDVRPLAAQARRPRRRPRSARAGATRVVVGKVTQNKDPGQAGPRARDVPGARRQPRGLVGAGRRSGGRQGRGLMMLPQRRRRGADRVRARRRAHPYVIGSLWNGKGEAGRLVAARRLVRPRRATSS